MKLRVEDVNDTLCVKDGNVEAVVQNQKYVFQKEEIESVLIITTDLGPFYDDMCLCIKIDQDTAIFIMSEHPSFKKVLFDELKTIIDIDYEVVIKAGACIENNIFTIYKR